MRFWAGFDGLIFCHDDLNIFWKIEKLIIFMGFFFQLVLENKSSAQISSK